MPLLTHHLALRSAFFGCGSELEVEVDTASVLPSSPTTSVTRGPGASRHVHGHPAWSGAGGSPQAGGHTHADFEHLIKHAA